MSTSTAYWFVDTFMVNVFGFAFVVLLSMVVVGLATKMMRNT